jgi:hypothetical protein
VSNNKIITAHFEKIINFALHQLMDIKPPSSAKAGYGGANHLLRQLADSVDKVHLRQGYGERSGV